MTEELIKELLSKAFVRLVAAYEGYGISISENDFGVDISINGYEVRKNNLGQQRTIESPNKLRIQLKSTTEKQVTRTEEGIKYRLKSKNYNDLVEQRYQVVSNPLILIVVIFPEEMENWLKLNKENLLLFAKAYYYMAEDDSTLIENEDSTKTILLREENRIDIGVTDKLYKEFTNVNR